MKPICILCALNAGQREIWLTTGSLNLRGTCACCGYISATVSIPWSHP